jgi:GNAT superfamily N-acetyltransferase
MSSERVTVRPAVAADVPTILRFIRELADYERAPEEAIAKPELLHEALFSARPACECFMGEIGGVPEGFALFFHNFSTWKGRRGVYLEDLYVTPAARGKGLGKALLARVASVAVERGCPRLEWAVLDWNTPALEFYRALGAQPLSEWTVHRVTGDSLTKLASLT